ncbi:MAG TPA: PA2169 family four-helix-bundle protein [Vicinamibacterales bacterium]
MTNGSERAVLNHLIETCKDAERGFRHVAEHVTDPYVKSLFLDIASQRERFAADLLPHAQRLGGASAGDGTAVGALHRTWIDLRSAIFRGDPVSIVHEAERGERFSRGVYEGALESLLPPTARELIENQYAELRTTAKRLRELEAS